MKLMILESGAKAKTVKKYLGKGWIVQACGGHVQDLPSKGSKGSSKSMWKSEKDTLPEPPWGWTSGAEKKIKEMIKTNEFFSDTIVYNNLVKTKKEYINLSKDITKNFELNQQSEVLDEIILEENIEVLNIKSPQMSVNRLAINTIKKIPAVRGPRLARRHARVERRVAAARARRAAREAAALGGAGVPRRGRQGQGVKGRI